MVVRDGSVLQASGRVVKVPGRAARFCAPVPVAAIGWLPGHEPPPEWCSLGVDVVGVDLTQLSQPRTKAGATEGEAFLRGIYRGGVLHVTQQTAPRWPAADGFVAVNPPDCPKPAGGWPYVPAGSNPQDVVMRALETFRRAHPGQVLSDAVARPNNNALYLVVTVADLAQARASLPEKAGTLCLLQSRYTSRQVAAAQAAFEAGMWKGDGASNDPTLGPGARSPGLGDGIYDVGLGTAVDGQPLLEADAMMMTSRLRDEVAAAPDGLVHLATWLQSTSQDAPLPPTPTAPAALTPPSTAAAGSAS